MNTSDAPDPILYWARGNRRHAVTGRGVIVLHTLCGVELGEHAPRKPRPPTQDVCTWCESLWQGRRGS